MRYNKDYSQMMVYLLNLSRGLFNDFRLGVPFRGKYHKVIDTDAQEFGGNGHNWVAEYQTEDVPAFHHQYSIHTKLLPLHGVLFKSVEIIR
jgi:1,4-alpha-glucan branching enzyme